MNPDVLEEILSCPSLPTLPAVALRVIELTSDPDISLELLSETIQSDQGLAAKILRTANSSFYAPRQKITTINQALVMLGLSAVKSLALGFSLVDTINDPHDAAFDYVAYWRRGLYTAVGAKLIARAAGKHFEDEAFLGGLLQDIGVVAMHKALGGPYDAINARTEGRHSRLARLELAELETQHADIGAMLGKRWKLPDELVWPIKYHERPTAAPVECTDLVRCVHLGNTAHDVLTDADPGQAHRRFVRKAEEWMGLGSEQAADLLKEIAAAAEEVSGLFRLDTGKAADAESILRRAQDRLVELAHEQERLSPYGAAIDELLMDSHRVDPITGAMARAAFDSAIRELFHESLQTGAPVAVVLVVLDGFDRLVEKHGVAAGDEALICTAALLRSHLDALGAVVSRWADSAFAVAVPATGQVGAVKLCAAFREDVKRASKRWRTPAAPASSRCLPATVERARAHGEWGGRRRTADPGQGDGKPLPVTVSVGAAALDATTAGLYTRVEQLVAAAARAVEASRHAGGDCIRAFVPRQAA
jgi:two-component system, cell cycle response regulator